MKSFFLFFTGLIILFSSCGKGTENSAIDYKQEMRQFVQHISAFARNQHPGFVVIPQNGVELVSLTGDETGKADTTYLAAIDGLGQEDLFYGYTNDNKATSSDVSNYLVHFLDLAKNTSKVQIMVTDYCSDYAKMDDAFNKNHQKDYLSFAADQRALDNIPDYPSSVSGENNTVIAQLSQAKNFLYLINPDNRYASSQDFVDAIKSTNYDVLIMDLFFNSKPYTAQQMNDLKQKANGGKRLLIAYMSIGEAEDYRYYWQADWSKNPPAWLEKENPKWKGDFYVWYWNPTWQNLIYGTRDSYTQKIIDAGFDGVYLDIIDAFERYE